MTIPRSLLDGDSRPLGLHLVRVALAAGAVLVVASGAVSAPAGRVAIGVAVHLGVTSLLVARAVAGRRTGTGVALWAPLLVDVVAATALLAAVDDAAALTWVPGAHVVAVALVLRAGTALRLAGLHVCGWILAAAQGMAAGDDIGSGALPAHAVGLVLLSATAAAVGGVRDAAARRRSEAARGLAHLGERCQRATTVDEVLDALVATARDHLPIERVAAVPDDADGRDRGPAHAALRSDLEPRRSDDGVPPTVLAALADLLPGARNVVVLPVATADRSSGWVGMEVGGARRTIAADAVAVMERYADHAALAASAVALRADLVRLATTDPLTGLANRRAATEALGRELARRARARARGTTALCLLDVDHFKSVNDLHGHEVGDAVLTHLGAVLRRACRASDLPARIGGEELSVLLPDTDLAGAVELAERLRTALAQDPGPLPVTVSVGVAAAPETAEDPAGLLRAADRALYRAKRGGRDQVRSASPIDSLPDEAAAPTPSPPGAVGPGARERARRGRRSAPLRAPVRSS